MIVDVGYLYGDLVADINDIFDLFDTFVGKLRDMDESVLARPGSLTNAPKFMIRTTSPSWISPT